jgi:hypothetical protein
LLATREAEIRRIMVQGQPRQGMHQTSSQPIAGCDGMHLSSYAISKGSQFQASLGKKVCKILSQQKKKLGMVIHAYIPVTVGSIK